MASLFFSRRFYGFLAVFILLAAGLGAQNRVYPAFTETGNSRGATIRGFLDWEKGTISASVELSLANTGIRLPTGRMRAEEILEDEFWRLLRPYILSMQVDSSSTIYDLIMRGELSLSEFDRLEYYIEKIPPRFSSSLNSLSSDYTIAIEKIAAHLPLGPGVRVPPRPFVVTPTANYTGIVIIADTPLPIHGRHTSSLLMPSLHPRIWDSEMNLIFERGMLEDAKSTAPAVFAPRDSIFRPTASGLESRIAEVVGNNPLRIIAGGVYGINPTDPVINRDDALLILSSENNRQLLREGRIAIIVNNSVLNMPFY